MGKSAHRLRPPTKWHGGKYYLAPKIVPLFGPHHTYVEPFGGAASVLLNKPRSPIEVYNDVDWRITRLFRVLRDDPGELRRRLELTPYSEIEFVLAGQGYGDLAGQDCDDEVELARRDLVLWRFSLRGEGKAFSYTLGRVRQGMADVVSGFKSFVDAELPRIAERLRTVQMFCRPALEVIRKYDGPDTLVYCDPPYLHSTRSEGSRNVYNFEMSEADHRGLAAELNATKSRVVLSGYPSELYDDLYRGWRMEEFVVSNNAAKGKRKARMRERIWMNW